MSVEVDGFEMVEALAETSAEGEKSVSQEIENEKLDKDTEVSEPVKIESQGDESVKGNGVSASNVPKDPVEEWPEPKQIRSFYFVRFRPYDDPVIKSKLDKLDREINQKNQVRIKLTDALRAKWVVTAQGEVDSEGCVAHGEKGEPKEWIVYTRKRVKAKEHLSC